MESSSYQSKKNLQTSFKKYSEKDKSGNLIEENHFLLQLLNIPYKDDNIPSFERLLQIALNIGQIKSNYKA